MKRSKFPEEQIAYALRQTESGTPVDGVCRHWGGSVTYALSLPRCNEGSSPGPVAPFQCSLAGFGPGEGSSKPDLLLKKSIQPPMVGGE